MKKFKKYIKDGVDIRKNPDGTYTVFTIPTQHFKVRDLEELTLKRFKEETKNQKKQEEFEKKIWDAGFEIKNGYIKSRHY